MSAFIVNGEPAVASGSIMIPPNVKAGIPLPGGVMTLHFKEHGNAGFSWNHWDLTITAPDNPLGIALDVPLTGSNNRPLTLAMTIHTVGQGTGAYRIIHYTAYSK